MRIIKKEKDGKLYDSHLKKYITLQDLLWFINQNLAFRVIGLNNEDITKETLFAVIYYQKHLFSAEKSEILLFIKLCLRRA